MIYMFDLKRIYTLKFRKIYKSVYGNKAAAQISDSEICDILKKMIEKCDCEIVSICLKEEYDISEIKIICNTKDKYNILFDFSSATGNKIEALQWK